MRSRIVLACLIVAILCSGCGRKLPPLPPAKPDPVEVISMAFDGEAVVAKAMCNIPGAVVTLLGKPKGICPHCTDDLVEKDKVSLENPGEVVLKDAEPGADYMVYRIAVEHDTTRWITEPRIVVKK